MRKRYNISYWVPAPHDCWWQGGRLVPMAEVDFSRSCASVAHPRTRRACQRLMRRFSQLTEYYQFYQRRGRKRERIYQRL